ncbi:amidase domain-containing protein [Paenibacillus koleovorans]|uniref:amidase domain-containing protein n=1 Tax=Paenibacillus koleovorans TaxID=121608 RepID=UPI000FD72A20|nr:amidase domain-containing protein [Paenibacillus koleovorans]
MLDKWKKTVYEYMHHRNQLESGLRVEPLLTTVRDDRYLRKQELRLRRLQATQLERNAKPVRTETGLVLRHIDEREPNEAVVVDVELRRHYEYELHGMKHMEDRREKERLTVIRSGNRWLITQVESEVPERLSPHSPPSEAIARAEEAEREPYDTPPNRTMPYLNPRLISGSGFDASFRPIYYNRTKAQEYANTWWNSANPSFVSLEVDCTNFVSQCLFAGGAPMNYTGKRETGWWYQGHSKEREGWSFSWAVAHSLCMHLTTSRSGLRADIMEHASQLTIGDVICYDWDGNGRFQHNTFVTAIDAAGMPLVNAHTVDSKHRYWDYKDSYAWTPNTKYRFCHIHDQF